MFVAWLWAVLGESWFVAGVSEWAGLVCGAGSVCGRGWFVGGVSEWVKQVWGGACMSGQRF